MKNEEIKPWLLERYILGELAEHNSMKIKSRLEKDISARHQIEKLIQSNKNFLTRYPSKQILVEIMRRYDSEKNKVVRKKRKVLRLFFLASSTISLMIVFITICLIMQKNSSINLNSRFENLNENRAKGTVLLEMRNPEIFIVRKKAGGVEQLHQGSIVKKGDLLQVGYRTAEETNGIIVSIDGNRVVTLHYPENINEAPLLQKNKQIYLGNSYELDNAPDFERFFLITSKSDFDLSKIMIEIETFANNSTRIKEEEIELDDNFNQISIILIKDEEK